MDLISTKVQVFGVPGFGAIDYQDWAAQCRPEFEKIILDSVRYEDINVRVTAPGRIMYTVNETLQAMAPLPVKLRDLDRTGNGPKVAPHSGREARHYQTQRG